MITVLVAYAVVAELVPVGHPLRWIVPITIILLPGFTDLMTAVNDDVGATAAFSLFLWTSIRTLRRGFSWLRLVALLLLTVLCVFTKSTSAIALMRFPVTLLFVFFNGEKRRWAWYILAASSAAACILVFTWGDADFWYAETSQSGGTRVKAAIAPHGSYVLAQVDSARNTAQQIFQLFPRPESVALRGKTVTLGVWIWATEPVRMNMPTLNDGVASYSQKVEVDREPVFYTLLLDEIGEMSQKLQVKLLRFLQEKKFERVGGSRVIQVDVGIIAATNKDLEKAVTEGQFREDLFYRLNVIPIHVPPLREREGDIPLLVHHFMRKHCTEKEVPPKRIAKEAMEALEKYKWPGNVRELENLIERLIIFTEDEEITTEDLPMRIR